MYSAREILAQANSEPVLIFEARLDNTAASQWGYNDWSSGTIENCGYNTAVRLNDNSFYRLTTGAIRKAKRSNLVVSDGLLIRKSIGDNFTSENQVDIGTMSIAYRAMKGLQFRDFDNRDFTAKIGGRVDIGGRNEKTLDYKDAPVLMNGRINGYEYDGQNLRLSLSNSSASLMRPYPRLVDNGNTVPVIVGKVYGSPAVDVGNGLHRYSAANIPDSVTKICSGNKKLAITKVANAQPAPTPAENEAVYDLNGNIRVDAEFHDQISIYCDGQYINGAAEKNSIEIIKYIISEATDDNVTVLSDVVGVDIGYTFDTERHVIEWVKEICERLDYYIVTNDDGSISIKERSVDLTPTDTIKENNIIEGTIRRIKSAKRYWRYRAAYQRDLRTQSSQGVIADNTAVFDSRQKSEVKHLKSVYLKKEDAKEAAAKIKRDGRKKHHFGLSTTKNWCYEVGQIVQIDHPLMPSGAAEIVSIQESTYRTTTDLEILIYE